MNGLNDVLNIGVPCYESLILPISELTLSCGKKKYVSIDREREMRQDFIHKLEDITGAKSMNRRADSLIFIDYLTDDKSYSSLGLDKKGKVINAFRNLLFLDERQDINSMKTRIRYILNDLTYFKSTLSSKKFSTSFLMSRFPNIALGNKNNSFIEYINNEFEYFKELYLHIEEITNLDISNLFDYYLNSLEPAKVGMFIAYEYILQIEDDLKNYNIINVQKYLFYLSAYLKNKANRNVIIYCNNIIINYSYIENRYKAILRDNPILKEIVWDRTIFLDKDKNDNINVINSLINMNTIKTNDIFIRSGKTDKKGTNSKNNRRIPTLEELEAIKEYLDYKLYIYLKNKPIAEIVCDDSFSNYKAFLYQNGLIAADRFYKVNTASEMKKDAIYIFDALNFPKKIQLSKQELIGNTPRIFHVNGWEDQIDEMCTSSTSDELVIAASYMKDKKRI